MEEIRDLEEILDCDKRDLDEFRASHKPISCSKCGREIPPGDVVFTDAAKACCCEDCAACHSDYEMHALERKGVEGREEYEALFANK